jgi:hypothetical protein
VRAGVPFVVLAFVENRGDSSIDGAVATIHAPVKIRLIFPAAQFYLGAIRAQRFSAALWLVMASKKGDYAILVSASGTCAGASVTGQDVALVTVTGR